MPVRAAVLTAPGSPLEVRDLDLPGPGPGQVRVRLAATGVCHSDLSLARGRLRQAVPAVLGHEGSGTVAAVGDGVTSVAVGDPVVLCWAPPCRTCWYCTAGEPWLCERAADASTRPYARLMGSGEDVYPGLSTGAFAEETVVAEAGVVPLPAGVDLETAALLGCAVMTGVGAVLNTAGVREGQTVLVVGLGGVGLSTVQGARIAGASQVLVVDPDAGKRELALRLGGTEALEPGDDLAKRVRGLTGGRGVDHGFDCVGAAATVRQTWQCTRRGGHATVVGIGGGDQKVEFSALELFHFARSLTGCVYGSMDPARDVPRLLGYVADGSLNLGALVSSRIGLDDVEDAFTDMAAGRGVRALVVP